MNFAPLALIGSALLLSQSALAGFKGTIEFSQAEKDLHLKQVEAIMETTADCIEADISRHQRFMKKYDISAFYGDNSPFAKVTDKETGAVRFTSKEEKRYMLRKEGIKSHFVKELIPDGDCKGGLDECPNMMQPTSCIGMVVKCLKKGFVSVNNEATWQKIRLYFLANNSQGDALLNALQALGWRIHYWNSDVSENKKRDKKDQRNHPGNPKGIWGQHEASWQTVLNKRRYYFNHVDDYGSLVNFGKYPPEWVKRVPFFIGIAHLGYHVFAGAHGDVVEAHSARPISDKETIERSEFSPGTRKGGPRGGMYLSGLLGVPPGYSPDMMNPDPSEFRDNQEEDDE